MKSKARVCSQPGCGYVAPQGGLCPECRREARRLEDRFRPSAAARGYDSRWRRTRARFLREHPYCAEPLCFRPATDAHHRDGKGPNGPLGHDPSNLQALCHGHHSRVTAREQPGGWAA